MRKAFVPLWLGAVLAAAPGWAQEATITAEDALDNSADVYGPTAEPELRDCGPEDKVNSNEIVVCRALGDQNQYRTLSEEDAEARYAAETMNEGMAPVVDVAGEGIFRGKPTLSGCFGFSCPPPMPVMIDLEAIPEAPTGSDADRAAKGELRTD